MKSPTQKTRTGFTMVEVLISLTILATLMTAVAFAFDAAVTNYQTNKGIYETVNRGRQALLRMTNDLRTANIVALEADDSPNQSSQISLFTRNGDNITYRFNSTNGKLEYVTNYDATDDDYVLCENITAMTFNRTEHTIQRDNGAGGTGPVEAVRDVRIVLTLTDETGNISQTLAAATLIRRNQ